MNDRQLRRMGGFFRARLPELGLGRVADPRAYVGKWQLPSLLTTVLVGLMAGCKSLAEVEELTQMMSVVCRRQLGIGGRVPDTTMRDTLCRVDPESLREVLHRSTKCAHRRKALTHPTLPFHVAALDGKVTSLPCWDDVYCQRHLPENGQPYGVMRTVTCALVSAPGRPCIDAIPIPARTNEMGHFQSAWASLMQTYPSLFQVVTYDAGASSEENARTVVNSGKDYVFRLRNESRIMYQLAEQLLEADDVAAETVDVLDNTTTVTRKLSLTEVQMHWSYGDKRSPVQSCWDHTKTFLRVESIKQRGDEVVYRDVRLYNSSLKHDALSPEQWLYLLRSHWGVENNNHNTLDTAFAEDDRPWITADPNGMLVVLLLRRIAYTLLTLFRSVTQRSDEARAIAWKSLMRWVSATLIAAQATHFAGLRARKVSAVLS